MDGFYIAYFLLHIVITLAIDATIALPSEWQLPFQRTLGELHIRANHDLLVASRPIWLQAFVWVEIFLQTPFFVWGAYDLSRGSKRVWPAMLAYGVEASATTFACIAEVCFLSGLTVAERVKLVGVYFPTLLIPLYMAWDIGVRISRELSQKAKLD